MSMGMKENRRKSWKCEARLKFTQGINLAFATGRNLGLGEVSTFVSLAGVDAELSVSPSLPGLRWRRFGDARCIVSAAAHVARWLFSGDHLEGGAVLPRELWKKFLSAAASAARVLANNFLFCAVEGEVCREMANSSNVVEREGDEGLREKSQRIFTRGDDQKKKFHRQGKLSQSPGGGMMMLDGCAGLGEHGREKDKSK
ncbi:hypothetical protein V8E51_019005 [Hyaloscypha variabilis]